MRVRQRSLLSLSVLGRKIPGKDCDWLMIKNCSDEDGVR